MGGGQLGWRRRRAALLCCLVRIAALRIISSGLDGLQRGPWREGCRSIPREKKEKKKESPKAHLQTPVPRASSFSHLYHATISRIEQQLFGSPTSQLQAEAAAWSSQSRRSARGRARLAPQALLVSCDSPQAVVGHAQLARAHGGAGPFLTVVAVEVVVCFAERSAVDFGAAWVANPRTATAGRQGRWMEQRGIVGASNRLAWAVPVRGRQSNAGSSHARVGQAGKAR